MKLKMKKFIPFIGLFIISNEVIANDEIFIETGHMIPSNGPVLSRHNNSSYSNNSSNISQNRSAVTTDDKLWPLGLVYYQISNEFSYSEKREIEKVIEEIERVSQLQFYTRQEEGTPVYLTTTHELCLEYNPFSLFPERKNDCRYQRRDYFSSSYIHFKKGSSCSSFVGKQGGEQILLLSNNCFQKSTILHEIMHAIGFYHEQQRYDRDQYVIIHWENIPIHLRNNYESKGEYSMRFGSYDYYSIMHYDGSGYDGGGCVMTSTRGTTLEYRSELSEGDINALNRVYNFR